MSMPERRRRVQRYSGMTDIPDAPEMSPVLATEALAEAPAACVPPEVQAAAAPEVSRDSRRMSPADMPLPPAQSLVATNTGVRMACTMAAMLGLFAIFLCWVEQESRAIRRFSVQSALLTALHAAAGILALVIGGTLGGIPYLGIMVTLVCLLGYLVALILVVILRVHLMRSAWQGVRHVLPHPLERLAKRYY